MQLEYDTAAFNGSLPIGWVIDLGTEARIGLVEEDGRYRVVELLEELPVREVKGLGFGRGLMLPCTIEITDSTDEPVALLTVDIVRGRASCVSINALPDHELTGAFIRGIPIAALTKAASEANTVRILRSYDGRLFGAVFPEGLLSSETQAQLDPMLKEVINRTQPRIVTDEFLDQVARIYREALAMGLPPSREVQRILGPTTSENARRWVMLARRRGLLGPALGSGRRGESMASR